jgi:AbrB family looped-hinge helix DNA binding protein
VRAFIGLGGNLGEPATAFRAAVSELRAIGQVVRVSSLYDSAPRDAFDQPHFLNAALELITDLEPIELLTELKRLELAQTQGYVLLEGASSAHRLIRSSVAPASWAFLAVRRRTIPMRITSKGQVTIPQAVREEAGLLPETEVDFIVESDGVRIVKRRQARRPSRGARAVERLRGAAGRVSMSTDEIMALTRGEG